MKKLNQKEWGIISASIGSILIIVALLTMVGVGSNDTYAAATTQCSCTSGTYDASTGKCIVTEEPYQCCTGAECESYFNVSSCSSIRNCHQTIIGQGMVKYSCEGTANYIDCECPNGTIPDGSGGCVQQQCPAGKYGSAGNCQECPTGSYCKDGAKYDCPAEKYCKNGLVYDCPENATCKAGSFTCKPGYKNNAAENGCEVAANIGECPAGTYYQGLNHAATCPAGSYCPGGKYNADTGDIIQGCEKIVCPTGYYCPAGVSEPKKCPTGKTTNTTGAKSDTYCIDGGCTSIGAKCTLNGKSGTCIDSGSNVGGLVCKIETSGSDDGGNPNTPSSGNPSSGGNPNTPSGRDSGTGGNDNSGNGGNGNTSQNPNTATKTPLVIAIIGTISMVLGTFAYFKGKKEINTEAKIQQKILDNNGNI